MWDFDGGNYLSTCKWTGSAENILVPYSEPIDYFGMSFDQLDMYYTDNTAIKQRDLEYVKIVKVDA